MPFRISVSRWMPFVMWILAFAAIPVWNALYPGLAYDTKDYLRANQSLQAGRDPYVDGINAETEFHRQLSLHPDAMPPYAYLYSPVTLPLLRWIGSLPSALIIGGYWLIYAAGVLAQILVSMKMMEPGERRWFAFLAPAAAFFPGLIQATSLMGGNIAYILYGLVFLTAWLGWWRGQWNWFYLCVLAVSCVKIPMMSLLAIPVLSARRQWFSACVTAAVGVSLYLVQVWIWPVYFHNYLQAIALEFSYGHAFGVTPAGLLGHVLLEAGLPYCTASTIIFVLYALPLLGLLLYLSRRFREGKFSLEQWVPVMVTGVILLNPRVLENDLAPLTLFMALILWRVLASLTSAKRAIVFSFLFFAIVNIAAAPSGLIDNTALYLNCIQGFVLMAVFAAGCWNLLRQTRMPNG